MPLMYRLTSIDAGVGRTLAYLTPEPERDLDKKIGAVVGILGDGTLDPSAMVNIVRPTTVDVLRPAGEGEPKP